MRVWKLGQIGIIRYDIDRSDRESKEVGKGETDRMPVMNPDIPIEGRYRQDLRDRLRRCTPQGAPTTQTCTLV